MHLHVLNIQNMSHDHYCCGKPTGWFSQLFMVEPTFNFCTPLTVDGNCNQLRHKI